MECTPGEGAVKIVEMTIKDLQHYIKLVYKTVGGFEIMTPNLKEDFTVDKMLSNSTTCYREITLQRKSQLMWQTSLLHYFKKLSQPP